MKRGIVLRREQSAARSVLVRPEPGGASRREGAGRLEALFKVERSVARPFYSFVQHIYCASVLCLEVFCKLMISGEHKRDRKVSVFGVYILKVEALHKQEK